MGSIRARLSLCGRRPRPYVVSVQYGCMYVYLLHGFNPPGRVEKSRDEGEIDVARDRMLDPTGLPLEGHIRNPPGEP